MRAPAAGPGGLAAVVAAATRRSRCYPHPLRLHPSGQQRRFGSYSVLGLQEGASLEEVKVRYVQLAKKHHPDMGGCEKEMKRLNEAYAGIRRLLRQRKGAGDIREQHAQWEREHGYGRGPHHQRAGGEDPDVDGVDENDLNRWRRWTEHWGKVEKVGDWLAAERSRQEAEKQRQRMEELFADEIDDENRKAFVAAMALWQQRVNAYDAAEAALAAATGASATPGSPLWTTAHTAFLAAWDAFNAAEDAWGVWQAPVHLRVGDVRGAEDKKKGLWDSEARQWRGEAWLTHALWKKRLATGRVVPG